MTASAGVNPESPPRRLLDVSYLIEASQPRQRVSYTWLFMGGLIAVLVLSALLHNATGSQFTSAVTGLLLIALAIWLPFQSRRMVRQLRDEQKTVVSIGEMLQLRKWTEAAAHVDGYLSRPARNEGLRVQALVFLGVVLSRYQRYDDAIAIYDYLLDLGQIDATSNYTLRLGRAMAVLHDERLVDADRAITDLRRMTSPDSDPSALGLLELYRDVKTGHADEAVKRFEKLLPAFQRSLGHRMGDAWALAARAYDLLGRSADAQSAYRNATLLVPPLELFRRYPETKRLEGKYEPAYAPPEAA